MGLGKTFQAIAVADFYRDDWPLLIVTTATARAGWESHIRDLLPTVPSDSIKCLSSSNDYIANCKVLITSYPLMDRCVDRLVEKRFGFVILVSENLNQMKNFCELNYHFIKPTRMNRTPLKISRQKVPAVLHAYVKRQSGLSF